VKLHIDAELVKKCESSLHQVEEKLIEMQNGCICCTLREDLLVQIKKLALEDRFDYLIIESTGISEPLQVAETFTFEDTDGNSLSRYSRLDTMVTMVDAINFSKELKSVETLQDRGTATNDNDFRSIAHLLLDQIEFANVIIINKLDLVNENQINKIEGIIKKLNPDAIVEKTTFGQIDLKKILNTNLFDFEKAALSPGWLKVLRNEVIPESEEYNISSFVYRARKPFHPKRLWDLLNSDLLDGVIRSKGFTWFATRNDYMGEWSSAGDIFNIESGGKWYCVQPTEELPQGLDIQIKTDFDPICGDRRQELVFIGVNWNKENIKTLLDKCLLSDEEMKLGSTSWKQFEDPFDDWEAE